MDCSTQFRIRNPSPAAASHFAGDRRRPNGRASFRPMSSTAPVEEPAAPEAKQRPSGDSFIRRHLRTLSPYQPILPFEVLSARLGRRPEDIIKLDANENPYGPPPEVAAALGNLKFPYVYPDPESRHLRAALAEDSGLESEYILAGCGADELIDLIMRCVLEPGDKTVDCPPTFTMYEFDASVNGALVIKGLAGLRVGYGAFPLSIIEYLWRAKQPYNVSVAAEVSACAALQNPTYLEVTSGKDAKKIKEDLAKMGVMIRHYDKKELKGYVRISVGKPEHTEALMKGLNALQL
ncbi:hypothetical protein HU200_012411 [Digitaria exilis]|uniref:histidinol-phosphate transaminase n=1 Tax=Digitaria exilis TaxID=1010633 RepID=A0A835FEY0_9POAL|nr:hypothetical protein HU200_012411 [Digitaria exilis]